MNIARTRLDTEALENYIMNRYPGLAADSLILLMSSKTVKQLVLEKEKRYNTIPLRMSSYTEDGFYLFSGIKIAIADWLEFGEVKCYEI